MAGGDLKASYLTSALSGINTLGRVGNAGNTSLISLQADYSINKNLHFELAASKHTIKNATYNTVNKDFDINEYNLGLIYSSSINIKHSLRYENTDFNECGVDNINNLMYAIDIKYLS